MPIKFRCAHCRQFLGISRSQAGNTTECPTCGGEIRVPDLEGPLGHADDQPASDDGIPVAAPPERADWPPPVEDAAPSGISQSSSAVAAPPPPVVKKPAHDSSRKRRLSIERPGPLPGAVPPPVAEPADKFRFESASPKVIVGRRSPKFKVGAGILFAAVLFSFIAGLAIGWLLGYAETPAAARSAENNAAAAHQEGANVDPAAAGKPLPAEVFLPQVAQFQVSGAVRFEGTSGGSNPDEGARIIAVPLPRDATRFPAAGLREAAAATDRARLQSAVASAGGRFGTADERGNFVLPVAKEGKYAVLILSRFQQRPATSPVSNTVRLFLDESFDQPGQVLGNSQYDYREITVTAGVPEDIRVFFSK